MTAAGVAAAAATIERWQYLAVLAGCLLVTLPLELVFGARENPLAAISYCFCNFR